MLKEWYTSKSNTDNQCIPHVKAEWLMNATCKMIK